MIAVTGLPECTSVSSANLKKIYARIDRYLTSGRSHNQDGGQKVIVVKRARNKQNLQFLNRYLKIKTTFAESIVSFVPCLCPLVFGFPKSRNIYLKAFMRRTDNIKFRFCSSISSVFCYFCNCHISLN